MAKVSAHGQTIGTIYGTSKADRYMSDGYVLQNIGFGWKIRGKVKPEITPAQAFERAKAKQEAFLSERPYLSAYRKELHDLCGMSHRWKLHAAIELMPNDPDGVWSEVADGYGNNISIDIDEVSKLCRLYRLAMEEAREIKNKQAA